MLQTAWSWEGEERTKTRNQHRPSLSALSDAWFENMSGAKLSGDFAHLFVQRTNGLYPNVGSLDLRPGSIVKANKFGSHDLVATLDVRILEESTKHNAKSDHQHIATAMEITKPGPRCDAHNLRDCHAVSHDFK